MRKQRPELPLVDVEAVSTTFSYQSSSEDNSNSDSNDDGQNRRLDRQLSSLQRVNSVLARNKKSIVEENEITNALANRAFHLPGYSYCADWCQYIVNNHMLFGMCCRHPKHPIGTRMRALNLLGSALFGLAITNVIWLGYIYYDEDPDSILFKISFKSAADNMNNMSSNMTDAFGNVTEAISNNNNNNNPSFEIILPGTFKDEHTAETIGNTLKVTKGMLFLWTVGGASHAIYDSSIWYASACACCIAGNRCESLGFLRRMGSYCVGFMVVLIAAVASFAVVLRATLLSHEEIDASILSSAGLVDDAISVGDGIVDDLGVFEFVIGYFVEFALAIFVYYPLFGTIMFSGALNWLGCGRVSWLGGRPYEMRQLEKCNSDRSRSNR